MSSSLPVVVQERPTVPAVVALGEETPSLDHLFVFARDAELRVRSLRMTVEERLATARGEETIWHEILLRNPGQARVTTRRSADPMSRDYEVWIGDADTVSTYRAADRIASVRRPRPPVVGASRRDLPTYARIRPVLTTLPADSLADTFIHPHHLFANKLMTGPLEIVGTIEIAGRESIVVRSHHPRSAQVLQDRPDRRVEVGIDRASGFLTLLSDRIDDAETRRAEVTQLVIDPEIHDEAFQLHLGSDVRMIY